MSDDPAPADEDGAPDVEENGSDIGDLLILLIGIAIIVGLVALVGWSLGFFERLLRGAD